MREILFRGQSIDRHKWYEGDLYQTRLKSVFYINYYTEYGDRMAVEVDPETVGQYTGLTANGKKMYEGDIVAGAVSWQERSKNGVVAFRDGSFGLIWYRGEIEQFVPFTSMCNVVLKIIGNIHDNPELLKEGEG